MDVAKDISEGFARNVISAKFNDEIIETSSPLTFDGSLVLFTWKDQQGKQAFWHSSSHVLAQALQELYPGVKLSIGPAIDNGFYYDVETPDTTISDKDFKTIENKMINWKYDNNYWVDPKDGFVWKSIQQIAPNVPPIILEITKAPS